MKWFHHDTDCLRNPKMRRIFRAHGVTGYGIWFALLEKIYEAEGNFQIEANQLWLENLAEELKVTDYRTLIRVFDTFAEVGMISPQLWAEHIIFCESILERGDAYIKRRVYETEKKRKQRASKLSPRDKTGTVGESAIVPLSDPDPDPDPEKQKEELINTNTIAFSDENHSCGDSDFENFWEEPEPEEAIAESTARPVQAEVVGEVENPVEDKGSAATGGNFEKFRELYNREKPQMWAAIAVMSPAREKVFKALIKTTGGVDNALTVLSNALAYARTDSWGSTKNLSFDNFASNGKIFSWHERYLSQPATNAGRRLTEGDAQMAQRFASRAEWFLKKAQ